MQRLVYFDKDWLPLNSLFHRATPEEMTLIVIVRIFVKAGITFKAAGAATPWKALHVTLESVPGRCHDHTPNYITSSGNVLSCCFAPFGIRVLENTTRTGAGEYLREPIERIWHGERYNAFRRALRAINCETFTQCESIGVTKKSQRDALKSSSDTE